MAAISDDNDSRHNNNRSLLLLRLATAPQVLRYRPRNLSQDKLARTAAPWRRTGGTGTAPCGIAIVDDDCLSVFDLNLESLPWRTRQMIQPLSDYRAFVSIDAHFRAAHCRLAVLAAPESEPQPAELDY